MCMVLGLNLRINFLSANEMKSEFANERSTPMGSLYEFFETQIFRLTPKEKVALMTQIKAVYTKLFIGS